MSGRWKPYELVTVADRCWDARHRDGRVSVQCRVAVLELSKAAAARAFGVSVRYLNDYGGETGNAETIAALEAVGPGIVLVSPLDPGGTVLGQEDWTRTVSR